MVGRVLDGGKSDGTDDGEENLKEQKGQSGCDDYVQE